MEKGAGRPFVDISEDRIPFGRRNATSLNGDDVEVVPTTRFDWEDVPTENRNEDGEQRPGSLRQESRG